MNFYDILVIVYLLGEFGCIINVETSLYTPVQIAGESHKKIRKMQHLAEKAVKHLMYRHSIEEPLRIKANKRIAKFQSHTGTTFTQTKPQHGFRSKRLWKKARKAADNYEKSKNRVQPPSLRE